MSAPLKVVDRSKPVPSGLELLSTAVVIVDVDGRVTALNPAAELLFEVSSRMAVGYAFSRLFSDGASVDALIREGLAQAYEQKRTDLVLERIGRDPLSLWTSVSVIDVDPGTLLFEFREHDKRWRWIGRNS